MPRSRLPTSSLANPPTSHSKPNTGGNSSASASSAPAASSSKTPLRAVNKTLTMDEKDFSFSDVTGLDSDEEIDKDGYVVKKKKIAASATSHSNSNVQQVQANPEAQSTTCSKASSSEPAARKIDLTKYEIMPNGLTKRRLNHLTPSDESSSDEAPPSKQPKTNSVSAPSSVSSSKANTNSKLSKQKSGNAIAPSSSTSKSPKHKQSFSTSAKVSAQPATLSSSFLQSTSSKLPPKKTPSAVAQSTSKFESKTPLSAANETDKMDEKGFSFSDVTGLDSDEEIDKDGYVVKKKKKIAASATLHSNTNVQQVQVNPKAQSTTCSKANSSGPAKKPKKTPSADAKSTSNIKLGSKIPLSAARFSKSNLGVLPTHHANSAAVTATMMPSTSKAYASAIPLPMTKKMKKTDSGTVSTAPPLASSASAESSKVNNNKPLASSVNSTAAKSQLTSSDDWKNDPEKYILRADGSKTRRIIIPSDDEDPPDYKEIPDEYLRKDYSEEYARAGISTASTASRSKSSETEPRRSKRNQKTNASSASKKHLQSQKSMSDECESNKPESTVQQSQRRSTRKCLLPATNDDNLAPGPSTSCISANISSPDDDDSFDSDYSEDESDDDSESDSDLADYLDCDDLADYLKEHEPENWADVCNEEKQEENDFSDDEEPDNLSDQEVDETSKEQSKNESDCAFILSLIEQRRQVARDPVERLFTAIGDGSAKYKCKLCGAKIMYRLYIGLHPATYMRTHISIKCKNSSKASEYPLDEPYPERIFPEEVKLRNIGLPLIEQRRRMERLPHEHFFELESGCKYRCKLCKTKRRTYTEGELHHPAYYMRAHIYKDHPDAKVPDNPSYPPRIFPSEVGEGVFSQATIEEKRQAKRLPCERLFERIGDSARYRCKLCKNTTTSYSLKAYHPAKIMGDHLLKCPSKDKKSEYTNDPYPERVFSCDINQSLLERRRNAVRDPVERLYERIEDSYLYRCKLCGLHLRYNFYQCNHPAVNMINHFLKYCKKTSKADTESFPDEYPERVFPIEFQTEDCDLSLSLLERRRKFERRPCERYFVRVGETDLYACRLCGKKTFYSLANPWPTLLMARHLQSYCPMKHMADTVPVTAPFPKRVFPCEFRPKRPNFINKLQERTFKVRRSALYNFLKEADRSERSPIDYDAEKHRLDSAAKRPEELPTAAEIITLYATFHHSLLPCEDSAYRKEKLDELRNILKELPGGENESATKSAYVHFLPYHPSNLVGFFQGLLYAGKASGPQRKEDHLKCALKVYNDLQLRPHAINKQNQLIHHLDANFWSNDQAVCIENVIGYELNEHQAYFLEHALILFLMSSQLNANVTHGSTRNFRKELSAPISQDRFAEYGCAWLVEFYQNEGKSGFVGECDYSASSNHSKKALLKLLSHRADVPKPLSIIKLADLEVIPNFSLVDGEVADNNNLLEYAMRLFIGLFTVPAKIAYWWIWTEESTACLMDVLDGRRIEFIDAIHAIIGDPPTTVADCVYWARQLLHLIFTANPEMANEVLQNKKADQPTRFPLDVTNTELTELANKFVVTSALLRAHLYNIDATEQEVRGILKQRADQPELMFPDRMPYQRVTHFKDLWEISIANYHPLRAAEVVANPDQHQHLRIRPIEPFMDDELVASFINSTADLRRFNFTGRLEMMLLQRESNNSKLKFGCTYFRWASSFSQFV